MIFKFDFHYKLRGIYIITDSNINSKINFKVSSNINVNIDISSTINVNVRIFLFLKLKSRNNFTIEEFN